MLKIIVDSRERNMELVEGLESQDVELEFATLPAGDYILSDRVCIERKTVSDFESSIMNARLFEQLERLKGSFQKPMLIIEGDKGDMKLSNNVILGATLKVYIDYGIQVLYSSYPGETAELLAFIARREQEHKDHEPRLVGIKKAYTEKQWQLLILGSIPGIGPKLAMALLHKFKSIKGVMNASIDDLVEVDKIGKKKAARVYQIINEELKDEQ
ncbi:MAG: ERCC4 domain-containing protein [Candidatus Micrarchaeia archaeon]